MLTGHGEPVISVAFSPDGTVVANGSDDDTFQLWDVSAGKQIASLKGHADAVTGVAIHPDGTILASGSEDGTIKLWNLSGGTATLTLGGHRAGITSVAFSPDGTMLASGSDDKTIKLWSVTKSSIDLAAYIDPKNPWCRLEGSRMSWNNFFFPASGPATSSFNGLHPKSKFLALLATAMTHPSASPSRAGVSRMNPCWVEPPPPTCSNRSRVPGKFT